MPKKRNHIIRFEDVRDRIITLREQQVILDFAVADLYGVETREINQAVKNNPRKFPKGWIFEVEKEELEILRSKISTTNVADLCKASRVEAHYRTNGAKPRQIPAEIPHAENWRNRG